MDQHAALAWLLAASGAFAAALGSCWGIARAKPPFGAPERHEIVERRLRFRDEHLRQAKVAVAVTGVLLVAAIMAIVLTSV